MKELLYLNCIEHLKTFKFVLQNEECSFYFLKLQLYLVAYYIYIKHILSNIYKNILKYSFFIQNLPLLHLFNIFNSLLKNNKKI